MIGEDRTLWRRIRASLLILLGCIPATLLCYFAAPAAIYGLLGIVDGDWVSLAIGLLGIIGLAGTFSLWAICLGFPTSFRYLALLVAIPANVVASLVLLSPSSPLFFEGEWLVVLSPAITATYLLIELAFSAYRLGADERAKTSV